jgi:hypothetical protein
MPLGATDLNGICEAKMLAFGAAQSTAAVWRLVPSMKYRAGTGRRARRSPHRTPICYDLRSRACCNQVEMSLSVQS